MSNVAFIRVKDITKLTTLSTSSIWDKVAKGTFPTPIKLSSRVTVWRLDEIEEWIIEQTKKHQPQVKKIS